MPPPNVCLPVPIEASQVIYRRRGGRLDRVQSFKSAPDGSFEVPLAPGRYLIDSVRGQRWGVMTRREVVIRDYHVRPLILFYDVGRRS